MLGMMMIHYPHHHITSSAHSPRAPLRPVRLCFFTTVSHLSVRLDNREEESNYYHRPQRLTAKVDFVLSAKGQRSRWTDVMGVHKLLM